jgi:hypothetical protein
MAEASHRLLTTLPGVGPSIARDLLDLGIGSPDDLVGRDPDRLYEELCRLRGARIDPCVKYVFRCAVYCATTPDPDAGLTKWWAWKDRRAIDEPRGGRP